MPGITWSRKARADLQEIGKFYLLSAGAEIARRNLTQIARKVVYLFENPIIGTQVPGLSEQYRYWLVLDGRYKIYFRRFKNNSIKVLRIYSTKRKPLGPSEIL